MTLNLFPINSLAAQAKALCEDGVILVTDLAPPDW